MANENNALSDEERAELEALRAEKAAREQAARDAADRAELEELRAAKAAVAAQQATPQPASAAQPEDLLTPEERAAREQGRKLMEPDDDLRMPVGQKIVLIAIFAVAIAWFLVSTLA